MIGLDVDACPQCSRNFRGECGQCSPCRRRAKDSRLWAPCSNKAQALPLTKWDEDGPAEFICDMCGFTMFADGRRTRVPG